MSQNKRPRKDVQAEEPARPTQTEESRMPESIEKAQTDSVSAFEALSAVVPVPDTAQWIIMFENGPGIKLPLEKLSRILNDIGVFTIDYVPHQVEQPDGTFLEIQYFFLTVCQELKERNGIAFFQFPLHYFNVSDRYWEAQGETTEMPVFACVLVQLLNALRNSGDLTTVLSPAQQLTEPVSNQAKLVTLSLDNGDKSRLEQIIVKPLSSNPWRDSKNLSKKSMTSKIPSVNIATMFEEYNKSHSAHDKSAPKAMTHYLSSMNFECTKFFYSVHNFPSSEMYHYLTKTVVSRQAPRELSGAGAPSMLDGDVLARIRLFTMQSDTVPLTLVLNIEVRNPSSGQTFDIRFPTQIQTLTDDERSSEERQTKFSSHHESMRKALQKRTRLVRVQVPMLDDEWIANYKPTASETKFDETYSARTLANLFSQGGQEMTTLYFGYASENERPPSDVAGTMLIEVNRVAVDDRIAQLLIIVKPLDSIIHSSIERVTNAALNENPFAESASE